MARATAWLLELGGGLGFAVGELELVHVLPRPRHAHLVGGAPEYCRQVFVWENEVVPIFDLAAWLGLEPAAEPAFSAIVRHRTGGGETLFASLLASAVPKRIDVDDEQACDLPPQRTGAWRAVAAGCFEHEGRAVPILDLPHVFSGALLEAHHTA